MIVGLCRERERERECACVFCAMEEDSWKSVALW